MTRYADTSAILPSLVGTAPPAGAAALDLEGLCTSAITLVELRRVAYRLRLEGALTEPQLAHALARIHSFGDTVATIAVDEGILDRAGSPLAVHLKTLDAIHLVTAIRYRESRDPLIRFLTADTRLAVAARAYGFEVVGVP